MPTLAEYLDANPDAAPKRKVRHPEWTLQTKLVGFVREFCAVEHEFAAHDRSENHSARQHLWERQRGIRAGWMDTELAVAGGMTFRCELKWGDNKLNDEQTKLIARMNTLGHPTAWTNSVVGYLAAAQTAGIPFRSGADRRAAYLDDFLRATFATTPKSKRKRASKPRAPRPNARKLAAFRGLYDKGLL